MKEIDKLKRQREALLLFKEQELVRYNEQKKVITNAKVKKLGKHPLAK